MKMNKFAYLLTLALGAWAVPFAASADGDIVDIRAVDSSDRTFGGVTGRNRMSDVLCTPDNPLVAGETLCIRVRMLVRNAEAASAGAEPQTWKFWDVNKAEFVSDPGTGVKLGLMIGEKQAWADYSLGGLNPWEFSGELKYDDNGASTITIDAKPGSLFPAVPAYTVDPDWYCIGFTLECSTQRFQSVLNIQISVKFLQLRIIVTNHCLIRLASHKSVFSCLYQCSVQC